MVALLHELFPWALAFFTLNALALASGRRRLLLSWRGERHGLRRRGLLAPGLLPTCEVLAVAEPRLWLASAGLVLPPSRGADDTPYPDAAEVKTVPWSALGDARARGRNVRAGGQHLVEARTPESASALAAMVAEWAGSADERQRLASLEAWLARQRSLTRLRERRAAQAPWLRRLRQASAACWGLGFVALPLSLYAPAQPSELALPLFAAATMAAAFAGRTAYKMLGFAGVSGSARWRALEPLLFYPPLAAQAPSFVARELYADFAPSAVAAELGGREAARALAGEEWLEIELGRARTDPAQFGAYWDRREKALATLLREADLGPAAQLLDRPRQDPQAAAYCPACDAEYRQASGACAECGIGLRAWPENSDGAGLPSKV